MAPLLSAMKSVTTCVSGLKELIEFSLAVTNAIDSAVERICTLKESEDILRNRLEECEQKLLKAKMYVKTSSICGLG
jgi:hypothetical protein